MAKECVKGDDRPGAPIGVSGTASPYSGVSSYASGVPSYASGVPSYTSVDKETQEMKKVLQSIIMEECSDLFQLYDFRLVMLSAQRNDHLDGYSFLAGVMSPRVDGGKTLLVRHTLARTAILDSSFRYNTSQMLARSDVVIHLCHQIARKLRHEVEHRTKETPVVANNPFSMHQSDTTSLTSASMITRLQQINVKASMITQLQQINVKVNEDDITSFCNPINRVSRFEHIDNLISDAKKRLSTGYAKPVLTFQYF